MKKLLLIALAFGLVGCAGSGDKDVSLDQATISAQPVTGGRYHVTVRGYSSRAPVAKLK